MDWGFGYGGVVKAMTGKTMTEELPYPWIFIEDDIIVI